MTATDRWQRVQALLESLEAVPAVRHGEELERAEPDQEVRNDVLRLLRSMREVEQAQESALREMRAEPAEQTLAGNWNEDQPNLKLVSLIGSGGSGSVYRGVRKVNGVEQLVAVKIYHAHCSDPAHQERFVREQGMLATLTDPGIVRFFDAGMTADGRHYLVMELAEGEHLTSHCDERHLSVEARLRLLLPVCHAVAAAHARLIVHLDLKPSNILVTPGGDIKLLDFGTARLIDHSEAAVVTQQLTPHYASPERLRGESATVASDVYSLGLILFELCAGGSPFRREASIVGMAERAGGRTAASGPAQAVSAESAALRGTNLARLRKQLTGDLASICAKALAFAPEDRYMTVAELAHDLRRYLQGKPVEAHAAGYAYRASKFVARYAGRLALAAVVVFGLSGAALYSWQQAQRANRAAERAEATNIFLTSILAFGSQVEHDSKVTLASVIELAESRAAGIRAQDPVLASDIELTFAMARQPEDKRAGVSVAKALELARAAGDVPREASALAFLGYRSYLDNHPDDAWKHLSQSMELWQRNRSAFSPIRAVFVLSTAGKYMTLVRPFDRSAHAPLTECLDIARSHRVPEDFRLLCLEGLATSLLFASRDYQKALPLLEEAVALRRKAKVGGPLAESLQLLGLNYRFLGRYKEDELAQRESYGFVVQKSGPDSLMAANQGAVWASALAGAGNPHEGLRQAEAALATYRRQYPEPGAPLLWTPLSAAMANACLVNGHLTLCERYAREGLRTLGANPSPRDTRLGTAQGYLGLALAHREDGRAEAKPLLEAALKMLREQNRNPIHRQVMEAALSKLQ